MSEVTSKRIFVLRNQEDHTFYAGYWLHQSKYLPKFVAIANDGHAVMAIPQDNLEAVREDLAKHGFTKLDQVQIG